jgi:hypothetical protein
MARSSWPTTPARSKQSSRRNEPRLLIESTTHVDDLPLCRRTARREPLSRPDRPRHRVARRVRRDHRCAADRPSSPRPLARAGPLVPDQAHAKRRQQAMGEFRAGAAQDAAGRDDHRQLFGPIQGHTGALYRACNWWWAPTWHRLRPPPTGNGSWTEGKQEAVKDRWVFPLQPDAARAFVLRAQDDAILRRWPWAEYREPGGVSFKEFTATRSREARHAEIQGAGAEVCGGDGRG